jgi:hypothetical protein
MNNNTYQLGKKDSKIDYNSKWPIFELNLIDKKGLWLKFKTKLEDLNNDNLLQTISEEDFIEYFYKNSDIEFEILFFDYIMNKSNFFKFNNKIYSYTHGKKNKRTKRKAIVRFYFNLNEIF